MSILWCGGEDIDFPNGSLPVVSTTASYFRSGFSRCTLGMSNASNYLKSITFSGITSGWLRAVIYPQGISGTAANLGILGFGYAGTNKGLYVGISSASTTRMTIMHYDGTTWTALATEAGNSWNNNVIHIMDIQLIDYGAAGTINVYKDGVLIITYTGDISISGVASFDSVFVRQPINPATGWIVRLSEVIVADEDTRTFSLVNYAPSAAGDDNAWTGDYTTVDETTNNDSDVVYTNTPDLDVQYNLTATPSGTFVVKQVKVAVRAAITAGASAATLELGVKTGGTINVDAGHALTTAWATYERFMNTNPVTAGAWTTAELDALQVNLQSET